MPEEKFPNHRVAEAVEEALDGKRPKGPKQDTVPGYMKEAMSSPKARRPRALR